MGNLQLTHQTYTKINTLYKRYESGENKGQIILGDFSEDVVKYLKSLPWLWYEKIDGTNFACYWDGHTKEYHGKTENAQIKDAWVKQLDTIFTVEKLQEVFPIKYDENGNEKPFLVKIYGELHGTGIQGKMGTEYAKFANTNFIFRVFDINIDGWWLEMDSVNEIASKIGVEVVPFVGEMTVEEAEKMVIKGFKSAVGDCEAEGLVGRIKYGLLQRNGRRIMVKIKTCDYRKIGMTE